MRDGNTKVLQLSTYFEFSSAFAFFRDSKA